MTPSTTNRRRFLKRLGWLGVSSLLLAAADSTEVEPRWLRVRRLRIGSGAPTCRFAYFTDLHYKGDRQWAELVVAQINSLRPDFVCFGGDLIEQAKYLPEALATLRGIQAPAYGVPGNHDFQSGANFGFYRTGFEAGGGAWLMNEFRDLLDGRVRLIGVACNLSRPGPLPLHPSAKNIVLMHYPAWVDRLKAQRFDLMLAGHSHGGQVRLPWVGSLVVPSNVGQYDMGLFDTPAGPLYVNPGIGWFYLDVRLNCRPEVTLFEV